jgi:orotate phosphoribosyltransferase
MKDSNRVLQLLEETGALNTGHFRLSSGLHSDRYCQCSALFEHPTAAAEVAKLAAARILKAGISADVVLAPALGGILWGYELARALGIRSIFAERDTDGRFALRRGFHLRATDRVLLAEDVVTTGKSVMETMPLVEQAKATVVGFCAVADRSKGAFNPPAPFHALVQLDFRTWKEDEIPAWLAEIPVRKPGSRPG